MTLQELIVANNWQSKTAGEVVALANANSVEMRDDALYTWAGVALLVGPENAEMLRGALDSNSLGWAVHQLGGSGIQLSLDLTQQMLTAFIGAGLTFCQVLKDQGIHYVSLASQNELGTVTEQQAATALAKVNALDAAADRYQAFREAIVLWDGTGSVPQL